VTVRQVFRALRRQWQVVVLGLAALSVLLFHVVLAPGVYYQQVDVVLLWPQSTKAQNTFQYGEQSLVSSAGLVATVVAKEGGSNAAVVSAEVTLVSQGVGQGFAVRLPNAGGQWAYNFNRPVIDVEVTGRTPAEVQATTARVIERIRTVLHDQQAAEGVPERLMIRTRLNPDDPAVTYSRGSRTRALAGSLLLGTGVILSLVLVLERRRRRRHSAANAAVPRHARRPAAALGEPTPALHPATGV
jgi:hypothetical protein